MKWLVWFLVLAATAVALTLASHNPGYVLLVYAPYRVEMSLTLFVLALLAGFVVLYQAFQLAFGILGLPEYVRRFRSERTRDKARKSEHAALLAFFEGRYPAAERAARQAMQAGESYGLMSVVAARAAHQQYQPERCAAYLDELQSRDSAEAALARITRARFLLDGKQPKEALEVLKPLHDKGGKRHVGAMRLALRAHQMTGDWDAALSLAEQLEKVGAVDPLLAEQVRRQGWQEKLRVAGRDGVALARVWSSIPTDSRRQPRVAATAARAWLALGDCKAAHPVLKDALEAQWDAELLELYGDCDGEGVLVRIEQAERWLKAHPQDAVLLLALGKLCMYQGLWGKARSYLDASLSVQPSRAAWLALAALAERLEQPEQAFDYYHKANQLAD